MKTPEEIQTEMMNGLVESNNREVKKLNLVMEKQKPSSDPSETLRLISNMLENNRDDKEFIKSMDLLVPVIIGMFSSSESWLVRDKAIECLKLINLKMGKSVIEKHLKIVSRKKRALLKKLL